MDCRKVSKDSSLEVHLHGSFNASCREKFYELVTNFVSSEDENIIINFASVDFIDSEGVGLLLLAKKISEEAGKEVFIKNPKGQVRAAFDTFNFNKMFKMQFDT